MRIIYGCNAQGQGHLSKAAVLVPILEQLGHEVHVVSSGPRPPAIYRFQQHLHLPGLAYALRDGTTDYWWTVQDWISRTPQLIAALAKLRVLVRQFSPDLIISDFEPLTASPLLQPPCEVVSMSRQTALLDPEIPFPEGCSFDRKLARTMIRVFTMGADRHFGFHYHPSTYRCLPPVVRPELWSLRPTRGLHLFVYNFHHTRIASADQLIEWSQRRQIPVRAYGYTHQIQRGTFGLTTFQPNDRHQMLADLAGCRAAIVTAGLTTPLEACLLGKPVVTVPLEKQWEQQINAFHLQQLGLAASSSTWDYDLACELPAPELTPPTHRWLSTSPETILRAVLGTSGGGSDGHLKNRNQLVQVGRLQNLAHVG